MIRKTCLLVDYEQKLRIVDILASVHFGSMLGPKGAGPSMGDDVSQQNDRQEGLNEAFVDFREVRHCLR